MAKVILQESIPSLGDAGDMVTVKDGYARNCLIPQNKALYANEGNLRLFEHQKKIIQDHLGQILSEAKKMVDKIESISCTISCKAGEEDKLFGSVTSQDIQKALAQEGIEIDRKMILLAEPIKILGVFTVPIKIHKEATANLKLWVVKDD